FLTSFADRFDSIEAQSVSWEPTNWLILATFIACQAVRFVIIRVVLAQGGITVVARIPSICLVPIAIEGKLGLRLELSASIALLHHLSPLQIHRLLEDM
ncbi:MAG TPA: hypothetical protein VFS83_02325, partial [Ktedonobacterales bacterium]|nr:hypothetical protein [Ktedonobacterales bacterium]